LRGVADNPVVTAVVVTWNSASELPSLLDSLVANPPSVPWEVVVVDNGSADATVAAARRHPAGARVIANARNRGLAAANNQGMRAARGSAYLICNPDVAVAPGCVDELLGCLDRHPRAAFAIARLAHPDGSLQTGVGDLPSLREALAGRRSARRRAPVSGMWWDGWSHDQERRVGHGSESCYLVRAAAVAEFGLQDEGYRLDWEGFDWSARAEAAGWEVWFCPTAHATHAGGASIRQAATARWVASTHLGMHRYFAARSPAWARPLLALAIGVRMVAKLAAAGVRRPLYQRAHRS
jgi:N-acetylglucosaminyl-diphospho-decaprenol L-rhamnosyltransferase